MTAPAPGVSTRSIIALGAASFMSSATIRVGDPLIPQIADDFGVGIAAAAIVSTAFALAYGVCQLIHGPLGDRFGKLRMIVLATALSGFGTASVAWADSLTAVGVLRFLSGVTASAIIPLSMAHIGDVVPYEQRQETLARFLFGQILGAAPSTSRLARCSAAMRVCLRVRMSASCSRQCFSRRCCSTGRSASSQPI